MGTVQSDLLGLTRFSTFLAECAPEAHALSNIDRALLERYLAWLATQSLGCGAKEDAVTAPGAFFQAIRQHGWDMNLPTTAVFFPGDLPARPPRLTRRVAEHIMAQVEAPANLDQWPNPEGRLITIILIRCGLRATDACTLPFDCLLHDGQHAAYLRYFNNKMRREAAVPIDEDLENEIRTQQQRVSDRWPGQHPHLFPALTRNASGRNPMTYYSYRGMLNSWLTTCEVHDRARPARPADPAPVAPHLRLPPDQPRRPPRGHPSPARSPIDPDDRPLRPDHRPNRPAPLGSSDQGQHQRRKSRDRPRRSTGTSAMGQNPIRHGHPDLAERILRVAAAADLSACQRLSDLPSLPDRTGVPTRTARTAAAAPSPSSMSPNAADRPAWSR